MYESHEVKRIWHILSKNFDNLQTQGSVSKEGAGHIRGNQISLAEDVKPYSEVNGKNQRKLLK